MLINVDVGSRIKDLRVKLNKTQQEFAKEIEGVRWPAFLSRVGEFTNSVKIFKWNILNYFYIIFGLYFYIVQNSLLLNYLCFFFLLKKY